MRVHGTTVLSCGCGIPWVKAHLRLRPLLCGRHGVVVIIQIR